MRITAGTKLRAELLKYIKGDLMKEKISLYARSMLTLIHIVFVKILNMRGFTSAAAQDFSLTTKLSLREKGKISLHKHIHTRRNGVFEADGGMIEIGEGCFFNNGCMVVSKERISIGKNTSFGPNVLVYDHDHNIYSHEDIHDSGYVTDSVIIGDNVWIGANSVILRGSVIGSGCVIGAGSVIKGTYPPDTVIVQKRSDYVKERSRIVRKDVQEVD